MSKLKTAHLWRNAMRKTSELGNKDTHCTVMQKPKISFHHVAIAAVGKRSADREKELKAKESELEELRVKYKSEQDEKTKLLQQLDVVKSSASNNTQKLQQYIENNERLRIDIRKKTEEIDKLQRNVTYMEDRIRNLEIKASEVEKAELTLDSTKKQLEHSQTECRGREGELRRMKAKLDETVKTLEFSEERNECLERKINDLKHQVRQELIKNETIEKGLSTIPKLQEELEVKKTQLIELEREVSDKTALLTASKQAIREYRDKLREASDREEERKELKEDLILAHQEIDTLKNLMKGKDTVMIQKLQALEQAKVLLNKTKQGGKNEDIGKLRVSIDKLSKLIRGDSSLENNTDVNMSPRSKFITNGQVNSIDIDKIPFVLDNKVNHSYNNDSNKRPVTAVVYPSIRTSSNAQSRHRYYSSSEFQSPLYKENTCTSLSNISPQNTKFVKFFDHTDSLMRTDSVTRSSMDTESESPNSVVDHHRVKLQIESINNLPAKEKDEILSNIINIGDRVKVILPQKQPRYGRKKLEPVNYCGIVKYKGYLDKTTYDARLMIGVRLDEPNGDTDGVINGKSFMYTPLNQGKYFKIRDVTCIFDKKSGCYVPAETLTLQYANENQPPVEDDTYQSSEISDSTSN